MKLEQFKEIADDQLRDLTVDERMVKRIHQGACSIHVRHKPRVPRAAAWCAAACAAVMKLSRSVSAAICSGVQPVCRASRRFSRALVFCICSETIWISVTGPLAPAGLLDDIGDDAHTASSFPQNRCMPSAALKPVAANTLKRSTTPKACAGTSFMPIAPTSIMQSATAAHMP